MTKTPTLNTLRHLTPSRLRLEAGGGAAPLASVLDFQTCHANARDAINLPVDWNNVASQIGSFPFVHVHSLAVDRATYIRRPDLGRSVRQVDLEALPTGPFDLAIVVADGLSAHAVNDNGGPLVAALLDAFSDLNIAPVIFAEQGRVGIGDSVGAMLQAQLVIVLIGERPGLSVTNSLGAYLTLNPKPGTPDSSRNCVSNIHGKGGLSIAAATHKINWLTRHALKLGVTGVGLKDHSDGATSLEEADK